MEIYEGYCYENGYRIEDGKIKTYIEGHEYYDVDWGSRHTKGFWSDLCDDTPENRKKYGISLTNENNPL